MGSCKHWYLVTATWFYLIQFFKDTDLKNYSCTLWKCILIRTSRHETAQEFGEWISYLTLLLSAVFCNNGFRAPENIETKGDDALKNSTKFTGKHLFQNLFFNEILQELLILDFIRITFPHSVHTGKPSWYLLVQSHQWKHQNKVWSLLKVSNGDIYLIAVQSFYYDRPWIFLRGSIWLND